MKLRLLFTTLALSSLLWAGGEVYAQDTQALTNEAIENYLFDQQYHAYQVGRLNHENGVGKRWYYRFRLMHITDVHANYDLFRQAFRSNKGHFDVICNTGDDANGCEAKDAPAIITTLDSISSIIRTSNVHRTPYINLKGNHDVTGITNADYFNRMCTTMQDFRQPVWGNAEEHRDRRSLR